MPKGGAAPKAAPKAFAAVPGPGWRTFDWLDTFKFSHVVRAGVEQWEIKCPFHHAGEGEAPNLTCRKTAGFTDETVDEVTRSCKLWCLEGRDWRKRVNHVRKSKLKSAEAYTDAGLDAQLEAAWAEPRWIRDVCRDDEEVADAAGAG